MNWHEGNLADARTQPNNVKPPQKIAEGSARGQCPVVLYEREGSQRAAGLWAGREERRAKAARRGAGRKGIRRKLRGKKNLPKVSTSKRESSL